MYLWPQIKCVWNSWLMVQEFNTIIVERQQNTRNKCFKHFLNVGKESNCN